MALEGWDPLKYEKQVARDLLNANKRAARKTGREVVKRARKALGKVDPKRKKMITSKVRKNGTLVHIDRASDSRVREYGMTANAKPGGAIRVNFKKEYRDEDGDFAAKRGGSLLLFAEDPVTREAKPIAVLKRSIRRKPAERSKRLSDIAEKQFDEHRDRIHEELTNG